jgi:hypothetical protein
VSGLTPPPSKGLNAKLAKALDRTHELLRQSNRLLEEYSEIVEHSRQLIDQSHRVIARAKTDHANPAGRQAGLRSFERR